MSTLHKQIKFCFLLLLFPCVAFGNAGEIGKIQGSGVLERGKIVVDGITGVGVQSMDTAVTAKGKMRIDFVDDTRVDITEHSRLLIDDFVFDPGSGNASLGLTAALGTVRYASGQIAKNYQQNVKIRTPSATIGVRGTDFIMVVDEIGGSMITLLPSCDTEGYCYTGEISVETDAGFVIMNKPFETTMASLSNRAPSPPLVLDLDETMISQLLILRKRTPYEEEEIAIRQNAKKLYDFLGIDFLAEFDALDIDALTESIEGIWITALDETDYMLADVLYNMLDMLNAALTELFQDELLAQNAMFFQTQEEGLDPLTGIYYELQDDLHLVRREDNMTDNIFDLNLSINNSYEINIEQQDFHYYGYKVGIGSSNSIDLIQRQY